MSGVGRFLKEQKKGVRVVAVEPAASPLLSKGKSGAHPLQGLGANFVPDTLDTGVYDEIITIEGQAAFDTVRALGKREGVLVGISSGAALYAALQLAAKEENAGKSVVAVLPDTGERYLSTALFEE